MECKLSEENTRLIKDVEHWKNECLEERRSYNMVREKEREWYDKYEVIMCNLMGKHITIVNESGYANFEACINDFIEKYKEARLQNQASAQQALCQNVNNNNASA